MKQTGTEWALPFSAYPAPRAERAGSAMACPLRRGFHAVAVQLEALGEAITAALLRRHLHRLLRQFDRRMLEDIGLDHAGIETMVRSLSPSRISAETPREQTRINDGSVGLVDLGPAGRHTGDD